MTKKVKNLFFKLSKHDSSMYGYELSRSEISTILSLLDEVRELEQYRTLNAVEEVKKQDNNLQISEWIPCSDDNLPEKEVLCCDRCGEIMLGYIFKTEEGTYNAESEHEYMYGCVAWQPLPQPYKESKNV